jgi:hypothetical protein
LGRDGVPGPGSSSHSGGLPEPAGHLRPHHLTDGAGQRDLSDIDRHRQEAPSSTTPPAENCGVPMHEWRPEDIQPHIAFQQALNAELLTSGELVDAQGLSDQAKTVTSTGTAPVITDGPFPESNELLAGYRLIDVESLERALDIAARASAAPGPNGVPIGDHIEVRQVMGAPLPEEV